MTRYLGVATDDMSGQLLREQLSSQSLESSGAARVGYDGETVEQALDKAKAFPDYSNLRLYEGMAEIIHITNPGIEGYFQEVAAASPVDNGGVRIVDAVGRAWDRIFQGPIKAEWFGFKSSNADNYPPLQAAFDEAARRMKASYNTIVVELPSGTFFMSQRATCKASTLALPSMGTPGISLIGKGQENTNLVATGTNTTGLIYFTADKNDELWRVQGMSFLSDLNVDAATNNGTALLIESTLVNGAAGFGDQPRQTVFINDVYVGGYATNTGDRAKRGNWKKGINIRNKWYPKIHNTRLLARYGVDVTSATRTACDFAIHNEGSYSPEYLNVYVHGNWDKGVWNDGAYNAEQDIEDFRLVDSFIVGPNSGFGYSHTYATNPADRLYEPGGSIDNTHIACQQFGIVLRNHRQVTIGKGVYIYSPTAAMAQGELLPAGILLDGAADIAIDAQWLEPGFYVSNTNASVCVRIEGGSEAISVQGQFGSGGIGVLNNSTYSTRKSIYVSPQLLTSRRNGSWGTLVPLVDNASTVTSLMPMLGAEQDKLVFANKKGFGAGYPVALQKKNTFVGQNQIAADEVVAANASAAEFTASVVRTSLAGSNTAGAERTSLEVFVRNGGSLQQALQLVSHTGQNQSWAMLLFDVGGTLVSKRVKLGAADSAGTGFRNIFVDN